MKSNLVEHKENSLSITGKVRVIKTNSLTGEVISVSEWSPNRIMLGTDTGKDLIIDRLNSTNTYSLNINYADIGTGTNTPVDGNTTLQTVTARAPKANGTVSSNVLSLFFFWASADLANGSYNEFGMFVDGTATVSTGKIFNRVLFGTTYTKATNEDTTVQCNITLT
jgi:hypothetical protein